MKQDENLERLFREFVDPGNHPGPYVVLARDGLYMVMDDYADAILWSDDREACELASACMNSKITPAKNQT